MKKIINGKMYNTETADYIGGWEYGCNGRDFRHCAEELYRKSNGEFFLYGEGGPLSPYAVDCGNNETSGGRKIMPFTVEEAKEWAENHISADKYIAAFGEPEE